jgi:hypothetical protein
MMFERFTDEARTVVSEAGFPAAELRGAILDRYRRAS